MFIETAMGSFGLVALPRAAQLFSENRQGYLEERVNKLISFIVQIGLFCTIHLAIWADVIIIGWVGSTFKPAIAFTRIISITIIPYMCFTMLKSIIDAVDVRAINTFNLLAALVAALLTAIGASNDRIWHFRDCNRDGSWILHYGVFDAKISDETLCIRNGRYKHTKSNIDKYDPIYPVICGP